MLDFPWSWTLVKAKPSLEVAHVGSQWESREIIKLGQGERPTEGSFVWAGLALPACEEGRKDAELAALPSDEDEQGRKKGRTTPSPSPSPVSRPIDSLTTHGIPQCGTSHRTSCDCRGGKLTHFYSLSTPQTNTVWHGRSRPERRRATTNDELRLNCIRAAAGAKGRGTTGRDGCGSDGVTAERWSSGAMEHDCCCCCSSSERCGRLVCFQGQRGLGVRVWRRDDAQVLQGGERQRRSGRSMGNKKRLLRWWGWGCAM